MNDSPEWVRQTLAHFAAKLPEPLPVPSSAPALAVPLTDLPALDRRIVRARAYLARMPGAIQGQNGSGATYEAACAVVHGFGLGADAGFALLWNDYNPRCDPRWSEAELRHKCDDAATKSHAQPAGYLLARGDDGAAETAPSVFSRAGSAMKHAGNDRGEPKSPTSNVPNADAGEFLNEADDDPHRIARGCLAGYTHPDGNTLAFWRDEWYQWRGSHWATVARSDMDAAINGSSRRHFEALQREYQRRANEGDLDELPKLGRVTTSLVANVGAALRQLTILRGIQEPPAWIGGAGPEPREIIAAANGLLHLPAFVAGQPDAIRPASPRYFNTNAVEFPVAAEAGEPREWLRFLASIWPNDPESVSLLQEWFGYLLTPDTTQQKMLLMVGPRRSGKGTISRVLQALVGHGNCCGPTLSGLAGPFGLQPMLGKSVAVIEDARLSGRVDAAVVVERLLAISGEGTLTVERKHLDAIDTRLRVRFVVSTNEIPRLQDTSGALASRWCLLRFVESFEGREDTGLADRLLAELPGILLWAVKGWERLRQQRRFTRPASSADLFEAMEEIGSPIGTFIKDCCSVSRGKMVGCTELYEAWVDYCEQNGIKDAGTVAGFGRLLRAALPGISRRRLGSFSREWSYHGLTLNGSASDVLDDGIFEATHES